MQKDDSLVESDFGSEKDSIGESPNSNPAAVIVGTLEDASEDSSQTSDNRSGHSPNHQDQFIPLVVRMKRDKQLSKFTNLPYITLFAGLILTGLYSLLESGYYSIFLEGIFTTGCLLLLITPILGFAVSQDNKKRIAIMQRKELAKYNSVEEAIQESKYFFQAPPKIVIDPSKKRIKNMSYILVLAGFLFIFLAIPYAGVDDDYCGVFCGVGTVLLTISGIRLATVADSRSVGDWLLVAFSITIAGISGFGMYAYFSY